MFLNGAAFQGLYLVTVPYLIMLAAYLPNGAIRLYNRLGDYSYGIYLLAFPVQQTIVSLSHGVKPWELTALSLPPTIILAALSWHLVERRALAMKTRAMPGGPSGINRMSQV
jgi:peptidoglycan/LPS O-acetylase OafA/YrhL